MKSLKKNRLISVMDYIYPPRCPICDRINIKGICNGCSSKLYVVNDDFCIKCGKPLEDSDRDLCHDCIKKKHIFFQNRGVYSYKGDIRWSLYRFKYANKREYGNVYGRIMAVYLMKWVKFSGISMIVPVPLHKDRERYRGYNQAEILAKEIGNCLDIPVKTDLLFRVKKTMPQKIVDKHDRRVNMSGAFAALDIDLTGEKILLVDDIYTTGNTMDQAAMELYRRGAQCVCGAVVAIGG